LEHQDGDGKVTNKYIKGRQIVRIRGWQNWVRVMSIGGLGLIYIEPSSSNTTVSVSLSDSLLSLWPVDWNTQILV
jgi:hypothetical protein